MAPHAYDSRRLLTGITICAWFMVQLLLTCESCASTVYDCTSWPGGTLNLASIVDCSDGQLGTVKSIPSELWQGPKFLIDVSRNGLVGSLNFTSPANSIRSITVSGNNLDGTLPTALPTLLKDLDLSLNNFSGVLPAGWSSATALRTIQLKGNALLTGSLPSSWSALVKLETLDVRGTGIGGAIPQSLSSLVRLSSLLVDGCNFTGCVPLGIPFPVPSLQNSGFLLKQCTAGPTQSPSKAPTTSNPTTAPSSSPSSSPTARPTFRPTDPVEIVTDSPTAATSANTQDVGLAVGIGIGVVAAILIGLGGSYFLWRRPRHSPKSVRKPNQKSSALTAPETPTSPAAAPLPAGPRPGRTFIPGQGWVQDEGASARRLEPTPPPAPPPAPRDS